MVAPRSTATPASSRLASRRLASDFRILFPAAVMLPLWAGVAHILICILDHGYYIAAITYVPANLFLAGIRTAVHMYADAQKAPLLYANIWLSIHVLGAVHGVLSSVILADLEAVPAGGPVIVGCFAAIWAVVCTVEGPVLKLPLRHRILGHACVLVRRAPSALLVAHAAPPLVPTLCGPPWALLARTHTHTHTHAHTHTVLRLSGRLRAGRARVGSADVGHRAAKRVLAPRHRSGHGRRLRRECSRHARRAVAMDARATHRDRSTDACLSASL